MCCTLGSRIKRNSYVFTSQTIFIICRVGSVRGIRKWKSDPDFVRIINFKVLRIKKIKAKRALVVGKFRVSLKRQTKALNEQIKVKFEQIKIC